jgi:hypothetical protein
MAMKDKKVSLSIFPIPHVKDCPSTPPAITILHGGWSELLGLLFRHLFSGGERRWRGGDHKINFLHRLSVAGLLVEDVYSSTCTIYPERSPFSRVERSQWNFNGSVYSQTFHTQTWYARDIPITMLFD